MNWRDANLFWIRHLEKFYNHAVQKDIFFLLSSFVRNSHYFGLLRILFKLLEFWEDFDGFLIWSSGSHELHQELINWSRHYFYKQKSKYRDNFLHCRGCKSLNCPGWPRKQVTSGSNDHGIESFIQARHRYPKTKFVMRETKCNFISNVLRGSLEVKEEEDAAGTLKGNPLHRSSLC